MLKDVNSSEVLETSALEKSLFINHELVTRCERFQEGTTFFEERLVLLSRPVTEAILVMRSTRVVW